MPFEAWNKPFTEWPFTMCAIRDVDGNGCDELLVSRWQRDGDRHDEVRGVDLLFLQNPVRGAQEQSPLLHATYVSSTALFGERLAPARNFDVCRVGDLDGDGVDEVAVLTWSCDSVSLRLLYLENSYTQPLKDVNLIGADSETRYWLRGCRQMHSTVKVGWGATTAIDLRFPSVGGEKNLMYMENIGDLTGDGRPELLIHHFYAWEGESRDLVVSPMDNQFVDTRLLGALTAPGGSNKITWSTRSVSQGDSGGSITQKEAAVGRNENVDKALHALQMEVVGYGSSPRLTEMSFSVASFTDTIKEGQMNSLEPVYNEPAVLVFEHPVSSHAAHLWFDIISYVCLFVFIHLNEQATEFLIPVHPHPPPYHHHRRTSSTKCLTSSPRGWPSSSP